MNTRRIRDKNGTDIELPGREWVKYHIMVLTALCCNHTLRTERTLGQIGIPGNSRLSLL